MDAGDTTPRRRARLDIFVHAAPMTLEVVIASLSTSEAAPLEAKSLGMPSGSAVAVQGPGGEWERLKNCSQKGHHRGVDDNSLAKGMRRNPCSKQNQLAAFYKSAFRGKRRGRRSCRTGDRAQDCGESARVLHIPLVRRPGVECKEDEALPPVGEDPPP